MLLDVAIIDKEEEMGGDMRSSTTVFICCTEQDSRENTRNREDKGVEAIKYTEYTHFT